VLQRALLIQGVLFVLLCTPVAGAAGDADSNESKSVDEMVKWLEEVNGVPPPQFGRASFIYEHWKHPRYTRAAQYEEQLQLQFRAQEAEQERLTPKQIAEIREAIPVNMALEHMNETYQKFEIGYAFDGEKVQFDRMLLEHKSKLEIPPEVQGNSRVRAFDPSLNSRQILAWDESTLRRYSVVDQDKEAYLSIVGTVGDRTMEKPPMKPNAPPLGKLREKIKQINPGTTPDGRPAYVVEFAFAGGDEDRHVRTYYDRKSGTFLMAESEGTQGDERLIFREQYTTEQIDGRPIPRSVEFISIVELEGDQPRIYERRMFTLRDVDFARPAPETFAPPIPAASNEVIVYNGNKLILDVSRMRVHDSLDGLITSLNTTDLTSATAVKDTFSAWNKGGGSLGADANGRRLWFWSVQGVMLALTLSIVVWKFLERRRLQKMSG
jgi:hypothetical protein